MPNTKNLLVKQPNQILTDMLNTIRAGLILAGIPNPQVGPGTDIYLICKSLSNQLAIINQNILNLADAQMPDTATSNDLDRILNFFGLQRRSASKAEGFCQFSTSQTTLIANNAQLTGPNGLVYKVVSGGSYADGSFIEVISVDSGAKTNLPVSSILTWLNTPAYASSTVTVISAITGGVDIENDATARQRLISNLSNPPSFGNWQQLANLVMSSDPFIQQAFIYSAANGPGSQYIVVTSEPTSTSIHRTVPNIPNLSNISSIVFGSSPSFVNSVVSTVVEIPFDVAFELTIPYPVGANSNGIGGGWIDYNPWPVYDADGKITKCTVASVTNSTTFVINSKRGNTSLQAGVTHINWINKSSSPSIYQSLQATILSATDNGDDTYSVTIDTPFPGIAVGDFIFPAITNTQNYINTVLNNFAQLGPGQLTNASTLLPMANRKPLTSNLYPSIVGAQFLKDLVINNSEVQDTSFSYQTSINDVALPLNINPSSQANGCYSNIPIPTSELGTYVGTNIYIPNNIAFYPTTG